MLSQKEFEILQLKNRIALLESRPKENYTIIRKLKRRLRKLIQ